MKTPCNHATNRLNLLIKPSRFFVWILALVPLAISAEDSEKSAVKRANEYATNNDGIGIVIMVSAKHYELFQKENVPASAIGEKIKANLAKYGVGSEYFWEVHNDSQTVVMFDLGELPYRDRFTGNVLFNISGAVSVTPSVAAIYKTMKANPPD